MEKNIILIITISLVVTSFLFGTDLKVYDGDRTTLRNGESNIVGYVPNEIVVKFKGSSLTNPDIMLLARGVTSNANIDKISQKYSAVRVKEMFPNAKPAYLKNKLVDLSGYYKIKFAKEYDNIEDIVAEYQSLAEVEKAEPIGIHLVNATPNDGHFADQWHLNQSHDHDIDAPEAWDIETGDDDVIVVVMDSGVRYFHKDLGGPSASYTDPTNVDGNMWVNWAEKNGVVGVDDDGNGFVDDWVGWDFVDDAGSTWYPVYPGEDGDVPDNDPRDFNGHGTHCAGNVAAINNNGYATCAASGGWGGNGNGVKVMACRIGYSAKYLRRFEVGLIRMDFAAEAFYYAADNGAKIATCSWGSSNSGGIDVAIDYFLSHDGIIFKSAGNDNNENTDYMTARSDIVAVAASDQNDCRSDFSSYGTWVDISAPGTGIMSLYHDHEDPANDYVATMDGTSMASPIAASVAALIWSAKPNYSSNQVKQRLFDTADDIYGESCNSSYAGKLGVGRVNAYNAINFDGPVVPAMSISDVTVTESNTGTVGAAFTVTLSQSTTVDVTVDYQTVNGTATAGSDYVAASGTVTFTAGTISQPIRVQVNGDVVDEPNETFFVNLSNAVNATIADNQGQCTIEDDDAPVVPAISINDVTVTEGDIGTVKASFTVTLSQATTVTVNVNYATANGTATAGSDYNAISGTLTFTAGTTSQPVTVQVIGDVADETNETFFVNLTNPINATIANNQGQGTIQDDDELVQQTMHVHAIQMTKQTIFNFYSAQAKVKIVDEFGSPVASAQVNGQWSGGVSHTSTATTGSDGWCTLTSKWRRVDATFTFCVTNVSKSGWIYDSEANVVTCASTDGSTSTIILTNADIKLAELDGLDEEMTKRLAFVNPNPFNKSTNIIFFLPEVQKVKVEVYNVLGKKIATLLDGEGSAGMNSITWNGTSDMGYTITSGTYFFRITFGDGQSLKQKMLLLK